MPPYQPFGGFHRGNPYEGNFNFSPGVVFGEELQVKVPFLHHQLAQWFLVVVSREVQPHQFPMHHKAMMSTTKHGVIIVMKKRKEGV
ncbi:hypothetical protein C2845_PM03G37120 [Panicum miliaceum]|uniref:Uncharacterized protein n=1 Tax=Panicum miliaceum TaxID=4540 RepID=A0A3L6TAY5_PANMI|nr:hypothetical protein C2845_PM03G37120 [Panicum miliaceum]